MLMNRPSIPLHEKVFVVPGGRDLITAHLMIMTIKILVKQTKTKWCRRQRMNMSVATVTLERILTTINVVWSN